MGRLGMSYIERSCYFIIVVVFSPRHVLSRSWLVDGQRVNVIPSKLSYGPAVLKSLFGDGADPKILSASYS